MTSLFGRAQQKIMQAYGPQSQVLTTLDIAAMAHSLSQHSWQKCLDDPACKDIRIFRHYLDLHLVAEQFLNSVQADISASCPDHLQYLETYPPVNSSPEEIKKWREWRATTSDPSVVAMREYHRIKSDEFDQRLQRMIDKNPAKYNVENIEDFCERVNWNPMLRDEGMMVRKFPAFSMISGTLDWRRRDLQYLLKGAEEINPDIHYARMNARINPKVGPDSEDELFMMLLILSSYARNRGLTQGLEAEENSAKAMVNFNTLMRENFFSMSAMECALSGAFSEADDSVKTSYSKMMLNSGITADDCLVYALGMCRSYYAHHQDKITRAQSGVFRQLMLNVYKIVFNNDVAEEKPSISTLDDEDNRQKHGQKVFQVFSFFSARDNKPTTEDLQETIKFNAKPEVWAEMQDIIDRTAPYFNLHVSYYVGQDKAIKTARRESFNGNKDKLGMAEVKREFFIRWLVANHDESLSLAGFSDEAMDRMFEKGRIDNTDLDACDKWTVDHIVDIQDGGTNDPHNLCLMPSWLNSDKSRFLELQLKGKQAGQWILTLRPKKTEGGDYAAIIQPKLGGVPSGHLNVLEFPKRENI